MAGRHRVIEGAVRRIVADRLDIGGARWGLAGAEAVPKLRTWSPNDSLPEYRRFHLARAHHRLHHPRPRGVRAHGLINSPSGRTTPSRPGVTLPPRPIRPAVPRAAPREGPRGRRPVGSAPSLRSGSPPPPTCRRATRPRGAPGVPVSRA
ncbi:hypothetical protein F8568_020910 [Actinomadura sp. LD22]|uniref:Uncharacterized protein n=1 Tax=Actinomadura physcomitrii TaxID=2650748 RepID=A0A6I4MGD4_9ACTN|nr:hypothetical protein [Actinomadura physcomitrii]